MDDVTFLPSIETLRQYAKHPAHNGTVPIYPVTLDAIANEIERLTKELQAAQERLNKVNLQFSGLLLDHRGFVERAEQYMAERDQAELQCAAMMEALEKIKTTLGMSAPYYINIAEEALFAMLEERK